MDSKLTVKELLCSRDFQYNGQYLIYAGANEDADLIWDSRRDGYISSDDSIASYEITYITVTGNMLILEIM